MPTYVYRCDTCETQFELFQRMSDDPLDTCPSCEGAVRRVIHPVGVVFKGSGWYINDSRSKSDTGSSTNASESSTDTGTAASKDTKDTKASKPEPAKTAAD